jgi:hypothetical protein
MRSLAFASALVALAAFAGPAQSLGPASTNARQDAASPAPVTPGVVRLACTFRECKSQCYYGDHGQLLPRAKRDACMHSCRPRRENCK